MRFEGDWWTEGQRAVRALVVVVLNCPGPGSPDTVVNKLIMRRVPG